MKIENKVGRRFFLNFLKIVGILFLFLISIDLISESFKSLGEETFKSILSITANPFISLFIGLLLTAIIQSSSTSTSVIVAVVASGSIDIDNAIPMIMGANVGTTLTSTIISLGFINNKNEYRKATSAGIVHDIFNIMTLILIFPLEYNYHIISTTSQFFTSFFTDNVSSLFYNSSINSSFWDISPLSEFILNLVKYNLIGILIALALLFLSVKLLTNFISRLVIGESRDKLKAYIFNNPYKSFTWGVLVTGAVQSSSVTTSLMVPLVATGKIQLDKSFPFVMGANLGTTITALIASVFKSGAGVSIALAHIIFNTLGVLIFMPFPKLRTIPIKIAWEFGKLTLKYRFIGFVYIIVTFFLIPFALIYFSR